MDLSQISLIAMRLLVLIHPCLSVPLSSCSFGHRNSTEIFFRLGHSGQIPPEWVIFTGFPPVFHEIIHQIATDTRIEVSPEWWNAAFFLRSAGIFTGVLPESPECIPIDTLIYTRVL